MNSPVIRTPRRWRRCAERQRIPLGLLLTVGISAVAAPVPAAADPTPSGKAPAPRNARFEYSRAEAAAQCPDADAIREGVAARLGYDPFEDGATLLVETLVDRTPASKTFSSAAGGAAADRERGREWLKATIRMHDTAAGRQAERVLTSRQTDCAELASAIELAISIAIDPARSARPPAEPASKAARERPPPAPTVIVIQQPPRPRPRAPAAELVAHDRIVRTPPPIPSVPTVVQARFAALGALGSAPAVAFGAAIAASLRRGGYSVALEGRADFAAATALRTGTVSSSLLVGSLLPCLHRGVLAGCAQFSAGGVRASGQGLVDARQVTIPYVAMGGRVALELPVIGLLTAHVFVDATMPLTETVLRVSGEPVWTSAPVSLAAGFGMGARFP